MGAWEMHHRSTKTRPTKPCLRRMVDPHLLASGVCEKERKSELNSRAAGKGVWHPSEGASRGAAAASKRARAARRRACGVGEVKLCLLARASRTPPTSARTMPPSHLTAKRHRRRTRRRRAVASQTTSAMRPPRRRGGRRVPAAGPSSVAGPARPSWPARLPTRRSRERAKCGKMALFAILHGDFTSEPRNESDRRIPAWTSVCALQFYTESILGTSSQSLVERSYGQSPLVCNDVEHCSTSLNTIE